ncbi:MAG: hypothetical protein LBB74_09915 [Chitinispirillales bacterium]|jgi:hypothetical protein|nr:hypothetical protein [Chitinispirillales bacterium]
MDTETTNTDTAATPASRPVFYARFDRSFGFEFALLIFLSPPLIVLWSFVAYYFYLSGAISFPILKVAVYYSGGFALALLLYGNNRATRRGMGVVLDGERIVRRDGGGVNMVDYEDIQGIRCTKNPLFNKKMAVTLAVGKTTLPLNLRGSYKMVETIFEKLAALGRFNENDNGAAAKRRLLVTAMQYNALYKIRGRHIRSLITVLAASALFNGAVATLYWERGLATALAWGFAGMLFQALGYLAAERLWAWKLFGRAVDTIRDAGAVNGQDRYDLFTSTHAAAAVTALLISMAAGIAVTLPAM